MCHSLMRKKSLQKVVGCLAIFFDSQRFGKTQRKILCKLAENFMVTDTVLLCWVVKFNKGLMYSRMILEPLKKKAE